MEPDGGHPGSRYDEAFRAHRAGDLARAAEGYEAVLRSDPQHADALHLSGVLLQQRGRTEEAMARIRAAIAIAPGRAAFRTNLAVCLKAAGRIPEALDQLREAARAEPGYAVGRRHLGVLLCATGAWEEACGHLEAALASNGEDPAALRKLGLARLMLGQPGPALDPSRRAVALDPGNPDGRNQLAVALRRTGHLEEAEATLRALLDAGSRGSDTLTNLGDILVALGRHGEALPLLEEALRAGPETAEAQNNLGLALEGLGRFDEAAAALRRALALNPRYAPALNNLGNDLLRRGRSEEGADCFRRALAIDPGQIPAWHALAAHTRHRFTPEETGHLERIVAAPGTPPGTRALLQFGLAAAYDREGMPDRAFPHALAANRWRKAERAREGKAFDRREHTRYADAILEGFSRERFPSLPRSGIAGELPLFIVGMPRSGTTLVEQILGSHPAVACAGELDDILLIEKKLMPGGDPAALDPAALREAAEEQMGRYRALGSGGATRVTDKTTVNFLRLGLIALLFPGARVIHCRREPMDVALSCFLHDFASEGLHFASDLADLGAFHRDYLRLMAHWREVLPLPLCELDYEALVAEPERFSRELVAFCGLEWNPRCLDFHRSDRVIQTASAQQVREPVYRRAVGRWKPYAAHLRPFAEALEGRLPEPADPGKTEAALLRATAMHQTGDFAGARAGYAEILADDPENAEALQRLGLIEHQAGRPADGLALIDRAIDLAPGRAEFHSNRAAVLKALGRSEEALEALERAVAAEPGYAAAWRNLAVLCGATGRGERTLAAWEKAVALEGSATAWRGLGRSLALLGRNGEAEPALRRAAEAEPESAETWNDLGVVLRELGRLDESEVCHRKAIGLDPARAQFRLHLGVMLARGERYPEALEAFGEALRREPENADARHNRGAALAAMMRDEEALPEFRRALELSPEEAEIRNSLGASLFSLGQFDGALAAIEEAIRLDPEHGFAHFNKAQVLLLRGDWERGFEEWEWRWRRPGVRSRQGERPEWDGGPLPGGRLLVYAEQGLGDTLLCLRFLRLARERAGRLIVECQAPLVPLLRGVEGVDEAVEKGVPAGADAQVAMMRLPGLFGARPDRMPGGEPPFFRVPEEARARWAGRLAGREGFRVGIGWQGNPKFKRDALRSIPLRAFAPLGGVAGVRWIALQQGFGAEQLREDAPFPIEEPGGEYPESGFRPFLETAALVGQLDLVISSDTALAHLAGNLGVPLWVAVPHVPDWRWLARGSDCPWYPSARLYRERCRGDWPRVFAEMAGDLAGLVAEAGRGG